MRELRTIMDEFMDVKCDIEELEILLMICETYCEERLNEASHKSNVDEKSNKNCCPLL